jgi:ABC-type multidrug transport system fused ATPase/permease subunit
MPPRVSTHGITLNAAAASKADPMSLLAPCHSKHVLVGVRQANKIRHAYLAAVLQQEVAFFDVEASSGKLLNSLNEDTVTIQNAIGEKVGNFVHHMSACVVGLAIGESQKGTCMSCSALLSIMFLNVILVPWLCLSFTMRGIMQDLQGARSVR